MAAIFVDLDGVTFEWGTEEFLPGAYEALSEFAEAGHQIIFTTQRDYGNWAEPLSKTERFLKKHFPNSIVLFGISSPRILINDAGAVAVNHRQNAPWKYDLFVLVDKAKGLRKD